MLSFMVHRLKYIFFLFIFAHNQAQCVDSIQHLVEDCAFCVTPFNQKASQFFICDSTHAMISQNDPQNGLILDPLLTRIPKIDRALFEVEQLVLQTSDGVSVPAFFINNHSDRVVVLGASCLQDPLHKMNCFAARLIRLGYDIMMFDYRWHSEALYKIIANAAFSPFESLVEVEKNEVAAAIAWLNEHNPHYRDIVGLGQCYSCYTFAAAQVEAQLKHQQGFTKLIFDSPWLSMWAVIEATQQEPQVCCCAERVADNPCYIKNIVGFPLIKWPLVLLQKLFCLLSPEVSIIRYVEQIKEVPILFLYGTGDIEVPVNHFNRIWAATNPCKATLVMPGEHTRLLGTNDNKKMYMHVVRRFIDNPFESFFSVLNQDLSEAIKNTNSNH
jgi:hypothetical protein